MAVQINSVQDAVREIVNAAAFAKPTALLQYAALYAEQMPGMSGHELHVQALYTLSNLSAWRGETAKAVKAYLKTL